MRRLRTGMIAAGILVFLFAGAFMWQWQKSLKLSEKKDIILIQKVIDDTDFWTSLYEGAYMAADEHEVNLTIWGPELESETEKQHQMILEAIEKEPDAIALTPSSYDATVPYAQKIVDAGIALVLIDSTMEKEVGSSVIATDNYAAGLKMGRYMAQFVEEDTVIGIVGHVKGTSTATEREQGFRDGLGDGQEKIAQIVFCDSSAEKAYDLTCEMLETYPGMNLIVGLNEYSAVGAARAVKELGKAAEIRMAGFDSSIEEIQLLEEGVFDAIVIQKPFNMGYLGIETAIELINGEKIPAYVDSGSELITKENMYTEENQKLLFPFFGKEKD